MVYRGTTVFCPIFGVWRGPDGVRTGSGGGSASQGPQMEVKNRVWTLGGHFFAGPSGRSRQGLTGSEVPKAPNSAKRGQKCQKSHFLTIFEAEMRFFIFERFVNPARDAFPVIFMCIVSSFRRGRRETKKRSRVEKAGPIIPVGDLGTRYVARRSDSAARYVRSDGGAQGITPPPDGRRL